MILFVVTEWWFNVGHDGMMVCVVESGSVSDPFLVSNGTRQGCVLAAKFFSLIFATMLFSALPAADSGLTARNRCNGWLLMYGGFWSPCAWHPFCRQLLCSCSPEWTRSARTCQMSVNSHQSLWPDQMLAEDKCVAVACTWTCSLTAEHRDQEGGEWSDFQLQCGQRSVKQTG